MKTFLKYEKISEKWLIEINTLQKFKKLPEKHISVAIINK